MNMDASPALTAAACGAPKAILGKSGTESGGIQERLPAGPRACS